MYFCFLLPCFGKGKNSENIYCLLYTSAPAAENVKSAVEIDFSNVKIEPLFEEMVDFETFSKSDYRAVKILSLIHI